MGFEPKSEASENAAKIFAHFIKSVILFLMLKLVENLYKFYVQIPRFPSCTEALMVSIKLTKYPFLLIFIIKNVQ